MQNENWEDLEIDLGWLDGTPDLSEGDVNELDIDFTEFDEVKTDNSEGEWDEGTPSWPEWDEGWDKSTEWDQNLDDEWKDKDKEGEAKDDTSDADTDTTLSEIDDLLKSLDDSNDESDKAWDEAQKIIDSLKGSEWTEGAVELITQLRDEKVQDKLSLDNLTKLVNKLNKEKWDLNLKNSELELYGTNDDAQLVYLNGNMTKARAGDEKSKGKIIKILDDIRIELAGKTLDNENAEASDDKISKFMNFNGSKISPNTKTEWWIDDFNFELT